MRELSTRGAFLAWFLDIGQFTPHEREYYVEVCDAKLGVAFEIYPAFPQNAD